MDFFWGGGILFRLRPVNNDSAASFAEETLLAVGGGVPLSACFPGHVFVFLPPPMVETAVVLGAGGGGGVLAGVWLCVLARRALLAGCRCSAGSLKDRR